MDPQSPNKLIATKYCFLILGDDTSFFFFISLFFVVFVVVILCHYLFLQKLFYYYYFILFIYFFLESYLVILFFHVPGCSGMFLVLSTPSFPLLSCQRDTNGHKAMLAFHGIVDEIELILARASIFFSPRNIDQMTICPAHRASLGIGCTRRVPDKCRIPSILSGHSKDMR